MTNFIVVVADDETYGQMDFMPFTRDMNRKGRVFSGCRLNVALCQPARMGLHSGVLADNSHNLCYNNGVADIASLNLNNMLAKWLDDVGYRTGLIGKWTNAQTGTEAVPTGWDTWRKFQTGGVAPAQGINVWDGSSSTPTTTHQIDYIADQFSTFISGTEPWCVFLCPEMPHVPYAPRVPDLFRYRDYRYPVPAETDVSDKPAWIQAFTQMTALEKRILRYTYRQALREVAGVEALVKYVYAAMDPTDTVLFFVSDNGFNFGEHNRRESDADPFPKIDSYEASIHVPLVVYGKDFTPGTTTQPCNIQDITKTIVAMGGATAPYTLSGVDLRDIQNNPSSYNTRSLLHQVRGVRCPDCDAITYIGSGSAATRKLIRYYGDVMTTVQPNGNVSSNNITVTGSGGIFGVLDDTSEADYVTGATNTPAEFIVDLQNVADPDYASKTEAITVSFRGARAGSVDATITCELRQGTTVISSSAQLLTSTPSTYSWDLTAVEINAITDYSLLRLRFVQVQSANVQMRIYYTSILVPSRTYEAYDLDTDPNELANWAASAGRITERNTLETALDALL